MSIIGNMRPRQFVEEFQKRAGLLIDGIAGPQTQMALGLVPELPPGRIYPAIPEMPEHLRTTPTPIDPADIRPGDVFRLTHEATCEQIDKRTGDIVSTLGDVFAPVTVEGMAWHLVSRPDPDAEAVEALEDRVTAAVNDWRKLEGAEWRLPNFHAERIVAHVMASIAPAALREQGWDVVRRAEP